MSLQKVRYELKKEITENPRLKILAYWIFISALGITIIKTIIRPRHMPLSETMDFLIGTLPNFFAGSMFFALAFVYYRAIFKNENLKLNRFIFAFLFSFAGLTFWEYIQYFMGFPIDYLDILMTGVGNLFTIIIILFLRINE